MLSYDTEQELKKIANNFISDSLQNNYGILDSRILNGLTCFEQNKNEYSNNFKDEALNYIIDIIKSDPRIHFYGVGEAYNYNGRFMSIENDPVITSKAFDNPFDAIYEEK